MSLLWRVFAVNAGVLVAATVALVATPATVSFPVAAREAVVLAVGLSALVALDLVLLRRTFRPLARLTATMRSVDPLRPGTRVPAAAGPPEIAQLTAAFNDMLGRLEAERRDSARRALAVQEAERRRISRELHDEVGQMLTGAMLELDGAARSAEPARAAAAAREAVRASLDEVRGIARRLRPEALDELGLPNALRGLAAGVARTARLESDVAIAATLPALSDEEELVLYRVAQEALTNVARHAAAERVALKLRRLDGAIELRVRDDGNGPGPAGPVEAAGIRGMRERAVLIGAQLTIGPAAGRGTEVRLRLPR